MAVYTYECVECGHTLEKEFPIRDFDLTQTVDCEKCHALAKRIINFNSAHRADPTWLGSACEVLQPDGEKPIESRDEFNKYLKKHDIIQRC